MRKFKYLLCSFIFLLIIPLQVNASGNVIVNKSSMIIELGNKESFTITAKNAAGKITISSSNSEVASVDKSSEWIENQTLTVNINAKNVGTAKITINIDAATFDEEVIKTTKTINITVKKFSTNNNLSDIKIDGESISNFSSSKTNYSINTEKSALNISAVSEDGTGKIVGTGNKKIKYGNNKFDIKVTSEVGTVKTYTINIIREDNRDTNNYLSNLSIDKGNITFNKNTTSYKVTVNPNVEKITISATAESNKAKISGIGSKKLKYGNNKFEIKVTAENESIKKYIINVNRTDNRSSEADLSNLSIEGFNIDFNKETNYYELEVPNDTESINISASSVSSKSKISGIGQKDLVIGENNFEIKVTAENGEVKTYTLNIIRKEVEIKTYTLIYDSNEGSSCETKKIEEGNSIGTTCIPKRDGYTFTGWYTSLNGGERITEDTKIDKDTIVHAMWSRTISKKKILIPIIVVLSIMLMGAISTLISRIKKQEINNTL